MYCSNKRKLIKTIHFHLAIIKIAQETLDFWRLCITQRFALLIVALSLLIIFCHPSQDALFITKRSATGWVLGTQPGSATSKFRLLIQPPEFMGLSHRSLMCYYELFKRWLFPSLLLSCYSWVIQCLIHSISYQRP